MSLINQMLRDLDARRGPASNIETAALQGMGLVDSHTDEQHTLLHRAGWAIGFVLAGLLMQQVYQTWSQQRARQEAVAPTLTTLPAMTQHSTEPARSVPVISTPMPQAEEISPTIPVSEPEPEPTHINEVHTLPPAAEITTQAPVQNAPPRIVKTTLTSAQHAQRQFDRAQSLLTTGQLRSAADALLGALELDPQLNEARLQLSSLYIHQGRTDRALQLLEAGHQIHPHNAEISMSYTRLLADQGEYQQALKILEPGLQQADVDADMLALAAGLHYRLKQFAASASRYREALAGRPDQAIWWMGLGVSLEHDQEPGNALIAYRRANEASLDTALKDFVNGRITALSGRTD